MQALAALKFARRVNKKITFNINARVEMRGDPIVNFLKGLFQHCVDAGHELIFHQWAPRDEFLKLCGTMHLGSQVSFSETFNIVGADLVSQGVPLVPSLELPWGVPRFSANPTDSDDIAAKMLLAYDDPETNVQEHAQNLYAYSINSQNAWLEIFDDDSASW